MSFDLPYTFAYDAPTSTRLSSYTGLKAAVSEWLGRDGDVDIDARFDDMLALHEARMYFGKSPQIALGLPACEPLRIRDMEVTDTAFALADTVAQPVGYLEMIEAALNGPVQPIDVVTEAVFAAYRSQSLGGVKMMAVSGTNFRVKDTPNTGTTATLRYFKRLTTPTPAAGNVILTTYPNIYFHGCLYEAAVYIGDVDSAKLYFSLYAADVQSLNERRNRELWASSNVRLRLRKRTP